MLNNCITTNSSRVDINISPDSNKGQRNDQGGRGGVLQGAGTAEVRGEREGLGRSHPDAGADHAEEHAGHQDPPAGPERSEGHQQWDAGS